MHKYWVLFFSSFYTFCGFSQDFSHIEDSLSSLSERFISDPDSNIRMIAFEKFESLLKNMLDSPSSFGYTFDSLHSISILYAPDSSFRIFTTQVQAGSGRYRHLGALEWRDEKKNTVFFKDQSDQIENVHSIILDPNNWYGALYYNMVPFGSENDQKYLLFGYDSFSQFHKRKLMDVLILHQDSISFGTPVIQWNKTLQSRFLLQYSADVKVHLNYDLDLGMIIYDNLIPIKGPYQEQGIILVPDGSYRGFKLENGILVEVEKIFFEVQDEPPGESPFLNEGADKDLFGRQRKG